MATDLVLVHPFPFDARIWDSLAAELHGVRVHALDLPGYGTRRNEAPCTSIDAMAEDVDRQLAFLELDQPWLGGMSMGGYVTLAYARAFDLSRFAGLLLCDTTAEPDPEENKPKRDQAADLVRGLGVSPYAELMVPKLVSPDATGAMRKQLRAWMVDQPAETVAVTLAALRDRPDARPGLAGIDVPVRCIVGELDALTPPAKHEAIVKALHGTRLEVIPGAGHLPVVDHPEAFAAAVKRAISG